MTTARALRLFASSSPATRRGLLGAHARRPRAVRVVASQRRGRSRGPLRRAAERRLRREATEVLRRGGSHLGRPRQAPVVVGDDAAGGGVREGARPAVHALGEARVAGAGRPGGRLDVHTQKRRWSSKPKPKPAGSDPLGDATPGDEEAAARKVREEDREYYRTHKPSPLAEVEFADTRKPVTRATDGGAEDRLEQDVPGNMVEDTADASLARAEAMFREAASRGNPAWPHSRALAAMLARQGGEGGDGTGDAAPWGS